MNIEISNKEINKIKTFLKKFGKNDKIKELEEKYKRLEIELNEVRRIASTPNCQKCGSPNVIKNGARPTKRRGEIQKFKCLECGHKFSTDTSFGYGMRNNEETIKKALALRKEGNSFAQIAEKIGGGVTRQTICRWLQKYNPSPTEEKIIKVKQKNQYGEFERDWKIKV